MPGIPDRAENRNKFSAMLDQLGIDQPAWMELTSLEEVKGFVEKVGVDTQLVKHSRELVTVFGTVDRNRRSTQYRNRLAIKFRL